MRFLIGTDRGGRYLLTAVVTIGLIFAIPNVSYAQSGALANTAKDKATDMPKIAVYVFGAEDLAVNKAMCTRLIVALSGSGRYRALDNYKDFFEFVAKAQGGGTVPLNSEHVRKFGHDFGVEFVCVAEITTALGESQITAFIINVETGISVAMGVADSPMKTLSDVARASEQIVTAMFKNVSSPIVKNTIVPQSLTSSQYYTLTTGVSPSGAGVVRRKSPVSSRGTNKDSYISGTNVIVTAVPADGYVFKGWSGNAINTAKAVSVKVDRDKTLMANFDRQNATTTAVSTTPQTDDNYSDDFSLGIRLGTWFINDIIPGLGSMILMQDYAGGVFMFGFTVGGVVMISSGVDTNSDALVILGLASLTGVVVGNVVRSCTYRKPNTRLGANATDGFNFAVLPKNGDLQYVAAYSKSF